MTDLPPALPDDETLTTQGISPSGAGRVLIVACGALAREIIDVTKTHGWDHLDLTCLPAIWHNHPERIADGVEALVAKHRDAYRAIYVAYADCGTGGVLQATCERLGVEMIRGPHCYSFFEGNDRFGQHEDEITAFYLTDFLARQFDAFVWKPLGLDRHPELREAYFGHYTKLVYQSQRHDPDLITRAQDCAARLGLAFEHRHTGYGDLESTLSGWAATAPK